MGHTGQHQEQTQLRQPTVTQHRRDAQPFGHPLEHEEQSKDRSQLRGQRQVGGLVEFAAKQAAGQWERLARVRFLTLPFWRKDSRRRRAGGELRLGMVATYMTSVYRTQLNMSR